MPGTSGSAVFMDFCRDFYYDSSRKIGPPGTCIRILLDFDLDLVLILIQIWI